MSFKAIWLTKCGTTKETNVSENEEEEEVATATEYENNRLCFRLSAIAAIAAITRHHFVRKFADEHLVQLHQTSIITR